MDVFAHALWGLIGFHWVGNFWLVISFSIIPDLAAFVPAYIYFFFFDRKIFKKADFKDKKKMMSRIPKFVPKIYNFTHSLVITGAIFVILFFTFKEYSFYIFPWMLHIILDIPSHEKDFFGTPILYPISDFKFNGMPWSNKWFMLVNYSLIIIVGIIVFLI